MRWWRYSCLLACGLAGCGDGLADVGDGAASSSVSDATAPSDSGGPDASDGAGPDLSHPCGEDRPEGDGGFLLGTGQDAFREVCQMEELVWVAGSQGSFHLEGGVALLPELVQTLDDRTGSQVIVRMRVVDRRTGALVAMTSIRGGFSETPSGALETKNQFLVIEPAYFDKGDGTDPSFAEGDLYRYSATVTVPGGAMLTQTASITSSCCD